MGLAILEALYQMHRFSTHTHKSYPSMPQLSTTLPYHQHIRTRGQLSPGRWIKQPGVVDQRTALEQSAATEHQVMRQTSNR